jgi:ribosomal protein S18 acetylase RimI-like enzyme
MSKLKIREATVKDAAEIACLVNAAYRPQAGEGGWTHESSLVSGDRTSPEQVADVLIDSVVLVGLHDAKLVACVQIEGKGNEAFIGMLAVEPSIQAGGLGKTMLTEAERYAESSLSATQFVLVVVSARAELVQFYLRRGYEETGQRLAYPINSGVGKPRGGELDLTILRKRSDKPVKPDGALFIYPVAPAFDPTPQPMHPKTHTY